MLPKDHKSPLRGRPVVSALSTPSTTLCKVLAELIKPLLSTIPAHLKSSMDFLNGLTSVNNIINQEGLDIHSTRFGSLDVPI